MEKMSETTTEDRISALPDCVLLRILSFLNMNQVVRTSVLSKRWEYMWTSVPTLTFEYDNDSKEKIGMFVGWVNRTLLRCRDTGIDKFNVDFRYNQCYESDVDGWARFAADKKARGLSLHFVRLYPSESYSLPQFMFCSSILMNLSIRDCKLMPRGDLSWTSLKSLSISFVELNDDVITKILCGSPMLEYLKIARCSGLNLLKINSKSLTEMVVVEDFTSLLEISAPNLQSLHISGSFGNVQLKSVSSLRRAELNFSLGRVDLFLFRGSEIGIRTSDDEYAKQCHHFIKLIGSLHHEVELELGLRCVQLLSVLEVKAISLPSSRRKYLKLKANIDKLDLPGIICLLKSLPYLEKLVIEESPETTSFQFRCSSSFLNQLEDYWKSERRDLNLSFLHLKTVEFSGFTSFSHPSFILNFIQLLLQNARVLEKMVINVGKYDKKCSSCLMSLDLLELSKKLLKIRRLSPHAEIIFS